MRSASHKSQFPEHGCFDCKHGIIPCYKDHLLCFYGDADLIVYSIDCESKKADIELNGLNVGLLEGDEYDQVWGGRVVDPTDICDEWLSQ